ncbi:unnamed protein product [Cunninghamella echinulata]
MTTTTYTFFRDGSKGAAKICNGTLHHESDDNQAIAYRIKINESKINEKVIEIHDEQQQQKGPILKGQFANSSKSRGVMEGFNTSFYFVKGDHKTDKWTFRDPFNKNKPYLWDTDMLGISWKLKDEQNQLIARFDRSGLRFKKQGVLTIYSEVPSHILACILLSHKMLHLKLKKDEKSIIKDSGSELYSFIVG